MAGFRVPVSIAHKRLMQSVEENVEWAVKRKTADPIAWKRARLSSA